MPTLYWPESACPPCTGQCVHAHLVLVSMFIPTLYWSVCACPPCTLQCVHAHLVLVSVCIPTLYWSACACLPMTMGFSQPGTSRGMLLQMMASLNTVPPRMLRIVPFGDRHICFNWNSNMYKK